MNAFTSAASGPVRARRLAGLIALPLALLAGACSSAPADSKPAEAQLASLRLLKALEAEIGDARCSSEAQCHSLAVGAKACGGPEGYRAWSSQRSGDGKKLQALAAEQAAARRAEQSQSGMMSNCALEPDPGAQCLAGRCVLRPALGLPQKAQ